LTGRLKSYSPGCSTLLIGRPGWSASVVGITTRGSGWSGAVGALAITLAFIVTVLAWLVSVGVCLCAGARPTGGG
jgi:hypothetical protein